MQREQLKFGFEYAKQGTQEIRRDSTGHVVSRSVVGTKRDFNYEEGKKFKKKLEDMKKRQNSHSQGHHSFLGGFLTLNKQVSSAGTFNKQGSNTSIRTSTRCLDGQQEVRTNKPAQSTAGNAIALAFLSRVQN